MQEKSSLERLAPLSGVAFAVLGIGGTMIAARGEPDFVGPPEEWVQYYTRHDGDIMAGGMVFLLAVFALLWFLGSVRRLLRDAEGGDGRVSSIGFAGGVVGAAMLLGSAATTMVAALRVDDQGTISADLAATMGDLSSILFGLAAPLALGVLVAASAVVGFRHAALPAWLAWTSSALAVLMVIPFIAWAAIAVFPLWAVTMSVLIYRRETAPAEATSTSLPRGAVPVA
jgi:hypothetical protein